MNDFSKMSARELRKIAPAYGVTGASRMTKDEIVLALSGARQPFDREARDALHRVPQVAYDPAGHLGRVGTGGLNRFHRRHVVHTAYGDAREATTFYSRRKRHQRVAGLMVPAVGDGEGNYLPMLDAAAPAARPSVLRRLTAALSNR